METEVMRGSRAVHVQVDSGRYSSQFLQFGSDLKILPCRPTFKPAARGVLVQIYINVGDGARSSDLWEKSVHRENKH